MEILYYIVGALLLIVLPGIFVWRKTMKIANRVYNDKLRRDSRDKWGRVCSAPENEEQAAMFAAGCAWRDANKHRMTEVHITNDGLNLYGEYYDFGKERCVIIAPGRCETLMYSCYFAITYTDECNVLVIDPRSHGLSDGEYMYFGVGEGRDLNAWARFAGTMGNKEVILHGICVGGAACVLAASSPDRAQNISAVITEGCFTTFYESFKQHMLDDKKPVYPVLWQIKMLIKRHTGVDVLKQSPIRCIDKMTVPSLFICGKNDVFSLPEKCTELFSKCGSAVKNIVWFTEGKHSHLRINNTEAYDKEILAFINN